MEPSTRKKWASMGYPRTLRDVHYHSDVVRELRELSMAPDLPQFLILRGVTGSGKTTIAEAFVHDYLEARRAALARAGFLRELLTTDGRPAKGLTTWALPRTYQVGKGRSAVDDLSARLYWDYSRGGWKNAAKLFLRGVPEVLSDLPSEFSVKRFLVIELFAPSEKREATELSELDAYLKDDGVARQGGCVILLDGNAGEPIKTAIPSESIKSCSCRRFALDPLTEPELEGVLLGEAAARGVHLDNLPMVCRAISQGANGNLFTALDRLESLLLSAQGEG